VRRRSIVGILASLAIASCTLTTDLGGLSGGVPDALQPDVASEGASPEGSPFDGGGVADATPSGCARVPDATFCVDFDHPNPLATTLWTTVDLTTATGTTTLVTNPVASPPNAARFEVSTVQTPCSFQQLGRTFNGGFSSVTARLSVRPEDEGKFLAVFASTNPALNYRVLVSLQPNAGMGGFLSALVQKAQSGVFSEVANVTINLDTNPVGTYHDVTVELRVNGATKSIAVTVDGKSMGASAPADLSIDNPRIEVGPYCVTRPSRMTIDDVAVTVTP
jgi:hypothetical protein